MLVAGGYQSIELHFRVTERQQAHDGVWRIFLHLFELEKVQRLCLVCFFLFSVLQARRFSSRAIMQSQSSGVMLT